LFTWENRHNITLTPLGEIDGQVYLVVANTGEIFGIWGNVLYKYGESFEDAIENTLILPRSIPIKYDVVY
jgi:hypothetical protein